jgi:hypothetical protein
MPSAESFHKLSAMEPRLLDLEEDAKIHEVDEFGDAKKSQSVMTRAELEARIRSIVGPGADDAHGLLASKIAPYVALRYLCEVANLDME